MKNFYTLLIVLLIASCGNKTQITITKVDGSAPYSNSSISLNNLKIDDDNFTFSFDVINYELGIQSLRDFDYTLANSNKGQHIHFIVNNTSH